MYAESVTKLRSVESGEYYHLFNRGALRGNIFREKNDWLRFLFLVLYSQSPVSFKNVKRVIQPTATDEGFAVPLEQQSEIIANRFVGLTAFCFMPNHFHLLVRQIEDHGIARYMQRVIKGYTEYFNTKYETSGHLFQGRYKSTHVSDNRQLLYLSAYIHRNSRELRNWTGKEEHYPYSSLQDYVNKNRWGSVLETDLISNQFDQSESLSYREFVRTSTAKDFKRENVLNPG